MGDALYLYSVLTALVACTHLILVLSPDCLKHSAVVQLDINSFQPQLPQRYVRMWLYCPYAHRRLIHLNSQPRQPRPRHRRKGGMFAA